MDERSGWCEGCLRTLDEIAEWSVMEEHAKRAVWKRLPQRRQQFEGMDPAALAALPSAPKDAT